MTEQEPLYVYKKGEGWVILPLIPRSDVFERGGKHYYIEMRKPEPGEMYSASNLTSKYWDHSNNQPKWSVWKKRVISLLQYFRRLSYTKYD